MPPVDFNGGQSKSGHCVIERAQPEMHWRCWECVLTVCTPANNERALWIRRCLYHHNACLYICSGFNNSSINEVQTSHRVSWKGYWEDVDRAANLQEIVKQNHTVGNGAEFWYCIVICNCNDLTCNMLFWYVRGGVVTHLVCIFCNCAYLKVSLFCSTVCTFLSPVPASGLVNLCCCWFTLCPLRHNPQLTVFWVSNGLFEHVRCIRNARVRVC